MSATAAWRGTLVAEIVARSGADPADLMRTLQPLVEHWVLGNFEEELHGAFRDESLGDVPIDSIVPAPARAAHGIFFTPLPLAMRIAAALPAELSGTVVDLSCGDGALLTAVAKRSPAAALVGVEREPLLAVAAALNIWRARGDCHRAGDFVHCGDGLAAWPQLEGARAVVGNPPYVGEKGNRALFAAARAAHPHLDAYFGPRIDLHYLFLHRAVELLAPGGMMVQLTSEYWLTATGAKHLRRHLAESTTVRQLARIGEGAFPSAPGHHSLLLVAQKSPADDVGPIVDVPRGGAIWTPFAEAPPIDGRPLGDLCADRQGFVSGADRLTTRNAPTIGRTAGSPIFLWRTDEIPTGSEDLFRPLLRRSDCLANRVWREPPPGEAVLWADDSMSPGDRCRVEALLEPYRDILEVRREVQRGRMPWYRIWWPRNTAEYARPKLVVPRRATAAHFCLDLSGAHVSSDCTFVLCDERFDAIPSLLAVMLVANEPRAFEHLRQYGKTKGRVVEFYSEPLRQLPLDVSVADGVLVPRDERLRRRWEAGLQGITTDEPFHDL